MTISGGFLRWGQGLGLDFVFPFCGGEMICIEVGLVMSITTFISLIGLNTGLLGWLSFGAFSPHLLMWYLLDCSLASSKVGYSHICGLIVYSLLVGHYPLVWGDSHTLVLGFMPVSLCRVKETLVCLDGPNPFSCWPLGLYCYPKFG